MIESRLVRNKIKGYKALLSIQGLILSILKLLQGLLALAHNLGAEGILL